MKEEYVDELDDTLDDVEPAFLRMNGLALHTVLRNN